MSPNWKLAAGLVALPALTAAAPTSQSSKRIVGGTQAAEGAFPFIVSLSSQGKHLCDATLLNANTIMTAAHCTAFQSTVGDLVRAGSNNQTSGGVVVGISGTLVNKDYGLTNKNNDIALWYLDTPIEAGGNIAYAKLPVAGTDPAPGTSVIAMGWGLTSEDGTTDPDLLQQVTLPIVDRTTCQNDYSDQQSGAVVTDTMFCAGATGKATCQGDSGGPVIDPTTGAVVGIVSWANGCGEANQPGVYTRVSEYIDWINANLK